MSKYVTSCKVKKEIIRLDVLLISVQKILYSQSISKKAQRKRKLPITLFQFNKHICHFTNIRLKIISGTYAFLRSLHILYIEQRIINRCNERRKKAPGGIFPRDIRPYFLSSLSGPVVVQRDFPRADILNTRTSAPARKIRCSYMHQTLGSITCCPLVYILHLCAYYNVHRERESKNREVHYVRRRKLFITSDNCNRGVIVGSGYRARKQGLAVKSARDPPPPSPLLLISIHDVPEFDVRRNRVYFCSLSCFGRCEHY